jgi:DNA polymerase V
MFGERVTTLEAMREAVDSYMHRATQKLRKQQSLTAVFRVAVLTSPFGDGPKYANSVMCYQPYPTDDVLLLTRAAMEGLEVIWRDGYRYSKAEILLMDLRKRGEFTGDLFTPSQPARSDELMRVLDRINMKFGKNVLHSGRMPIDAAWAMKREMMSKSYTTSIDHLMRFQAT